MKLFTALFIRSCEIRLAEKQSAGWKGWNTLSVSTLKKRLLHNVEQGDWIDVANLAMFLWARRLKSENKSFKNNESEKQNNPYEEEKLIKDALPSETYAHYGRFGSIKRGRKL